MYAMVPRMCVTSKPMVKPGMQPQEYEPAVFVQLCWQPPLFVAHSLMSMHADELDGATEYPTPQEHEKEPGVLLHS